MISLPGPPNDFTECGQHLRKLILAYSPLGLIHHVTLAVRVELLALVSGLRKEGTIVPLRKQREVEADYLPWVKAASEDLEGDDTMAVTVGTFRLVLLCF